MKNLGPLHGMHGSMEAEFEVQEGGADGFRLPA